MARVFWDGEKIVATACTANIKRLVHYAKKYNATPLPAVNGYAFARTIETIRDLSTLDQTAFDSNFLYFLNKINNIDKNKKEFIEKLNLPEYLYPFQKEAIAQIVKWNQYH